MDVRSLAEKTTVFENPIEHGNIAWLNPGAKRIYYLSGSDNYACEDDCPFQDPCFQTKERPVLAGFMLNDIPPITSMHQNDLPIEFFNHQLLACNPDSEDSVFCFVSKWGFPFSPTRERMAGIGLREEDREEGRLSIEETKILEKWLDDYDIVHGHESVEPAEIWGRFTGSVISLHEAAFSIRIMQSTISRLREAIRRNRPIDLSLVNAASCNPVFVGLQKPFDAGDIYGGNLAEYSFFTSAICNQIIEAIADSAPWRACACVGCSTIFKHKQNGAHTPHSDSVYCCKPCEERQKKRNQINAAKNRIRH